MHCFQRLVVAISILVVGEFVARSGSPAAPAMAWIRTLPIIKTQTGAPPVVVDLAAYYAGVETLGKIESADGQSLDALDITTTRSLIDGRPTAVALRGRGEHSAGRLIRIELLGSHASARQAILVAEFKAVPLARFVYQPKKPVREVFVAGSFNGWNAGANQLSGPDARGVYRGELPVTAGHHMYKFVVDGNWITDPANPHKESDGNGHDNSVIEIAGTAEQTLARLLPVPDTQTKAATPSLFLMDDTHTTRSAVIVVMAGNAIEARQSVPPQVPFQVPCAAQAGKKATEGLVRILAQTEGGPWSLYTLQTSVGAGLHHSDWRGRSIYFAMTDRFANGNEANDKPLAAPPGVKLNPAVQYQGGDWAGLKQKIENGYFDELGVGALWISGVNAQIERAMQESVPPGNYFTSYHGYWPTSPTATNPHFGSLEDLRAVVHAAHEHGVYVLLDLVAHHVGAAGDNDEHPWHRQHSDWFGSLQLPDGKRNIRQFDAHPFTTWFDTFLPALDYGRNPAAVDAMTENAVWWVKQTDVDGFRQDAVKHVEPVFWRALTRRLHDEIEVPEGRKLFQIGETISNRETINQFVSGEMLDGQFDFPVYWPLRAALGARSEGLDQLARAIEDSQREYPDQALMAPLMGNHDVSRFMAFADGDLKPDSSNDLQLGWQGTMQVNTPQAWQRLAQAQAVLLTLPGCPMLYYGDEIGLTGAMDPDNRRMMKFAPTLNANEQAAFACVSKLGQLRKHSPALRFGSYQTLLAEADTLVYARVSLGCGADADQVMLTLLRRGGARSLEIPLPANFKAMQRAALRFSTNPQAETTLEHGKLSVALPADSAAIIELQ
jgi:glycosidase